MLRWIVGSSLRFRFIVVAIAAAMVLMGVDQMRDMRVDVFPEFAPPKVESPDTVPRALAGEVEELVTVPLEQALNGMPELDELRSKSVTELSSIVMVFDRGIDLMLARQLVQERLRRSPSRDLPTWAGPPVMLQPLSATSRVMKIGISSKTAVRDGAVDDRLLDDPGPAAAACPAWPTSPSGANGCRCCRCRSNRIGCRANDVTLDQVMEATADALDAGLMQYSNGAMIGTGGFIETPNQRLGVRHVLPIVEPDDLAAGADRRPRRQAIAPRRRGRGGRGPPAARSATRSSTAVQACCSSSRSCHGPTRSR